MSTAELILRLETKIERLERKVSLLIDKKPTQTLIKAGQVMELTGWNKEQMRRARLNGWVKLKTTQGGRFYILESIPKHFLTSK